MTQQQQLRSTVTSSGQLKLELAQIEVPAPTSNEVLVRVEASPINPSDLGLLFGMADSANDYGRYRTKYPEGPHRATRPSVTGW